MKPSDSIFKNSYVRATAVVALLTPIAGLLQANADGPIWMLSFSALYLGMFLLPILLIASIVSVARHRKEIANIQYPTTPIPLLAEKNKSINYKKRFIWCLVLAVPGLCIYLFTTISANSGDSGTEFIALIFWPLLLLSLVAVPAAVVYGLVYLLKKNKSH
jgi:hypothetical protein